MRVMRLVFEKKKHIFSNDVYSGKKLFLKICLFSSIFFLKHLFYFWKLFEFNYGIRLIYLYAVLLLNS